MARADKKPSPEGNGHTRWLRCRYKSRLPKRLEVVKCTGAPVAILGYPQSVHLFGHYDMLDGMIKGWGDGLKNLLQNRQRCFPDPGSDSFPASL